MVAELVISSVELIKEPYLKAHRGKVEYWKGRIEKIKRKTANEYLQNGCEYTIRKLEDIIQNYPGISRRCQVPR